MASALRVQVSPSALVFPLASPSTSKKGLAIVFVTNGPGELSTWVRPLVERLHSRFSLRPRNPIALTGLQLVLVPCPNSTGLEHQAAESWEQFERILPARYFWDLLIRPHRFGPWPREGLVVFLGGDQFWTVLLSARLGYRHLTYAEWVARWPRWNDRVAAMSEAVRNKLPLKYQSRCRVVGDLMADLSSFARKTCPLDSGEWVALLPGSKTAKLRVGMPFLLDVAEYLSHLRPGCKFLLPVAPTTSVDELIYFASQENPISSHYLSRVAEVGDDWLTTKNGTRIKLLRQNPAHGFLSQCDLALTTVGANTAELGALGVPMIVIIPTQHLHVMQAWDGSFGLIARLPGLRRIVGVLLTLWKLNCKDFLALPNIRAGRAIVPERVGPITPRQIAKEASDWLESPKRLDAQRQDLMALRGNSGAVEALLEEVLDLLPNSLESA